MEEQQVEARPRGRRRRLAGVVAATAMAGSAALFGTVTAAAGDPPPSGWQTVDLTGSEWTNTNTFVPQYPLQYKLEDGWVHVRGSIIALDGATVSRGMGGPWRSQNVFTLPEGFRPECPTGGLGMLNDGTGMNGYQGGLLVEPDGTTAVVSYDAPVFEDGPDNKIGVVATFNFSFDTDIGNDCLATD